MVLLLLFIYIPISNLYSSKQFVLYSVALGAVWGYKSFSPSFFKQKVLFWLAASSFSYTQSLLLAGASALIILLYLPDNKERSTCHISTCLPQYNTCPSEVKLKINQNTLICEVYQGCMIQNINLVFRIIVGSRHVRKTCKKTRFFIYIIFFSYQIFTF